MPECSGAPIAVEAGVRDRAVDHGLMRERAARAAVFLRHRGAEQSRLPELVPGRALHDAVFGPLLDMRHELAREEAPRLLLEQHEILGHPGGRGTCRDSIGVSLPVAVVMRCADC